MSNQMRTNYNILITDSTIDYILFSTSLFPQVSTLGHFSKEFPQVPTLGHFRSSLKC